MNEENIKSGFRKTGIYPIDRSVYPTDVFSPNILTTYRNSKSVHPSFALPLAVQKPDSNSPPIETMDPSPLASGVIVTPPEDLNETFMSSASSRISHRTSFEEQLLEKISTTPTCSKPKRRNIDSRSRILTTDEFKKLVEEKGDTGNKRPKKDKPMSDITDVNEESSLVPAQSSEETNTCDEPVPMKVNIVIEKDEFVVIEFSEGLREKVYLIAQIVDIHVELVEVKFLKLSHLSQTFSEKNEKNGFVKKDQIENIFFLQ